MPTDYYRILGVESTADPKEIKEAYRRLALRYHPDRNADDPAVSDKMKALNEAYAVLSDPTKRAEYDHLHQQYGAGAHTQFRQNYSEQDIFRGSDVDRLFEEVTRAFGLRGFEDIFRECYGKGFRRFEFRRPGLFATGFFFSGFPGGRMRGMGRGRLGRGAGRGRGRIGAGPGIGRLAQVVMEKVIQSRLPAQGADLNDTIRISPELASQGGPYAYLLRSRDKKLIVNIPPGVRDGQRIRLAGMGREGRSGGQSGDMYLRVSIRQKQPLLEKLRRMIKS